MEEKTCPEFIFSNVNNWLKHAEQKNAYLFSAFSFMSLITVILNNLNKITITLKISTIITIVLYIFSLFVTLISLYPVTNISKKILEKGKNKKTTPNDNLLFYEDIPKYSLNEYVQRLDENYSIKIETQLDKDLINQILINSNITSNKYKCFKVSSVLLFVAILQFSIFFSISLF